METRAGMGQEFDRGDEGPDWRRLNGWLGLGRNSLSSGDSIRPRAGWRRLGMDRGVLRRVLGRPRPTQALMASSHRCPPGPFQVMPSHWMHWLRPRVWPAARCCTRLLQQLAGAHTGLLQSSAPSSLNASPQCWLAWPPPLFHVTTRLSDSRTSSPGALMQPSLTPQTSDPWPPRPLVFPCSLIFLVFFFFAPTAPSTIRRCPHPVTPIVSFNAAFSSVLARRRVFCWCQPHCILPCHSLPPPPDLPSPYCPWSSCSPATATATVRVHPTSLFHHCDRSESCRH